jgi:hypothetical protein
MLLRRIKKLKNVSSQNMFLHIRDKLLKGLSQLAIIVAPVVTSDPIVHSCKFRSQRSRRNCQRKKIRHLTFEDTSSFMEEVATIEICFC